MPKSKHRSLPPRVIAKDGSPSETVAGVIGGNMIVRRHELSRYVEIRLQAFQAEEVQPTVAGLVTELLEDALTELLPALVQKAVAAHYGLETTMQAPRAGLIVGLDGDAISGDRPALSLILPE